MIDPILEIVFAVALAALFATAAAHKWRDGLRFEAQLAEYRLLPPVLVPAASKALALGEAALVLALLLPWTRDIAAWVACVLLLGYGTAIAINLARGRSYIDCGCGDKAQLLSPWLLLRNAILAAGAVVVALPTANRAVGGLDVVVGLLSVLGLMLAWLIVEQILANASMLREWREAHD